MGKLQQWKAERETWLRLHPEPWDEKTEEEYHERFSRQIDEWLDQGSGSCVLRDPKLAALVADAIRHFDGERYDLASFVVMPNHVHVLFRPRSPHRLEEILKSWKGFTAREINRRIGKTGTLWQEDYWDRLIRNSRHFAKCVEYIRENPSKAKLREGEFVMEGGHSCPPLLRQQKSGLENPLSVGNLEAKVKTFCAVPQVLRLLKDFILFAEKEEELHKFILMQHQMSGADNVVARALDSRLYARAGLAHAGERQDLHDDQGVGDAFQSARGGEADHPADD